jgi:hypothetical protein
MLTTEDFATRYGEVIDIDDLARVLSASRRELQALLRSRNVDVVTVGTRHVVSADRAARALGLVEDDAPVAEMARVRREMSTRADGSRKNVREYLSAATPAAHSASAR